MCLHNVELVSKRSFLPFLEWIFCGALPIGSLSTMFEGRDGCTADAEHQRQQRRHIHVVYGPPRDRYARFAMPAMLGALATDRR